MSIVAFPIRADAMTLWGRYADMVREVMENPALESDPSHLDARRRAHQRFTQAFLTEGRNAQAG